MAVKLAGRVYLSGALADRLDFSATNPNAADTDGCLLKMGTATARIAEDTPDMKFMSMYLDNGATSGDNRGMYLRFYLTGTGGGGESARFYTEVEDVVGGTAHGIHASLGFGDTGKLTGLGVAARATLHIPNQAMSGGGTYAPLQAEVWSDGTASDPAGMTQLGFIRVVNGGVAEGIADVDDDAVLLDLDGFTASSGNMVSANTASGTTLVFTNWVTLRIDIGGTLYYIPAAQTIAASG
ncbi:MAG: hypothetical protein WC455_24810 [Dehalococcoidia bacterium]|jgi:hypothetical protein